ncbi:MAG: hypothetical protein LRY46_01580 [Candidatus Pacebacteria bacterium]|nr:hypothetical protein [Candidatus Paceibacterota bacterium]
MCYQEKNPLMVGLSRQSGQALVSMTSMEHPALALDLTDAMLKTLHPHNPVLAAFVAMIEQLEAKDFGVLAAHKLVRLPLSLIGVDKVRYRTPVVEMLHESILSFNMSDITKQAIQAVLGKHGYCMLFLCSCGVVIGKCADVKIFMAAVIVLLWIDCDQLLTLKVILLFALELLAIFLLQQWMCIQTVLSKDFLTELSICLKQCLCCNLRLSIYGSQRN